LSYNVTFSHLMDHLNNEGFDRHQSFDRIERGLDVVWPMPGGLKENILWLLGEEVFVRQIEGERHVYSYLKQNAETIANSETGFALIHAINCENGCMCGTAVKSHVTRGEDPLIELLKARDSVKQVSADAVLLSWLTPSERLNSLNERFSELDIADYYREYSDKSSLVPVDIPTDQELNYIFRDMRKYTYEDRHINCNTCGCDTCHDMAVSIFNGFNDKRNCVHYVKSIVDEEQSKLRFLAEHDQSLLIYNRRTITEMLEKNFNPEDTFSVILADINNFKGMNATYGNAGGDIILRNIATSLSNLCSKKGWECGRYGGDEFLIIIPGRNLSPDDPDINDLLDSLTIPTPIGGEWITATVSLGISNSDGIAAVKEHISCAEGAVRLAKTKGKNTVIEYSLEQKAKAREENEIREKVKSAIENDGFFMLYQPQINARTRSVSGYEALVRMTTPGIYPGQFIPIAEKNGWIWQIGRITTELVIKQLARWIEEGYDPHPVSINFSSNQLSDESYIDFLEDLLKTYNIPASLVEIEITEGLFLEKSAQALELFDRFKNLGIRLLMDDFGTGYSSLGYITYIPVDVIKLDKSLVDIYLVEGKDSFIHNVIRLMHDLDKEMIIEGVEEKWQYERLCELGADTIQGYYFSRPSPPEEAITFKVQ
ncbi:MAG: EAL domain-containing protein, partial [Lachnospiraceae bacterium]|nr:EAL domain-containing protein [Lachnospiraceae bacterium]